VRHRRNRIFATVIATSLVVLVSGAHAQIGGLAPAIGDGPIKTFPLPGIKDSPPSWPSSGPSSGPVKT